MSGIWGGGGGGGMDHTTPFTIPGATTARSLDQRFGDTFNVKDFGAVGDSSSLSPTGTDNTGAFNACISAIISAGGGIMFIPAGNYALLSGPCNLNNLSNCSLLVRGSGVNTKIIGNFNGYLFDRNDVTFAAGNLRFFENMNVYNLNTTAQTSGCIRLVGNDVGALRGLQVQSLGGVGINLGGDSNPPVATFSASSSASTTMTITAVTGTISNAHGGIFFPVPISGPGLTGSPNIVAQQSGTAGGAGVYTTSIATTTSGAGYQTNPNDPACFDTVVENVQCTGGGSFNTNPALSYTGIGVQLSNHTVLRNSVAIGTASGCQLYGAFASVEYCRFESNTYGVVIGRDPLGQDFTASVASIKNSTFESNYIGIYVRTCTACTIEKANIQGTNDGVTHNSARGIDVFGCNHLTIRNCVVSSTSPYFTDAGFYMSGQPTDVVIEDCIADANKPYGIAAGVLNCNVKVRGRCQHMPVTSDTLANWNNLVTTYTDALPVGESCLVSDATVALGSQVYGAAVVGGGANLARAYWDGTTYRYG
jgi:hypothetical protein